VNCNLLKELEVDGASYRKYIRVDRCHFQDLTDRVAPFIAKSNTKFHDAISVEERLALTLRFLATGKHSFTIIAQSSVYLPYWLFIFVFLV
jgi:acyl-CoA thioesterase FadM